MIKKLVGKYVDYKIRLDRFVDTQQKKHTLHLNDMHHENKRRFDNPIYLERFGYKVYSQGDEDGILNEIYNRIGEKTKKFVEFGVQDGLESNCHFLLHKGWSGLWIDGDSRNYKKLVKLFAKPIAEGQLKAINTFVTAENINEAIEQKGGLSGEIDLLSIDIDGNDYWIWNAITCVKSRVVVIEYNGKFPPPYEWVMPYNPKHVWDGSDFHGASLEAMCSLGKTLGYQLVATSLAGVNAFFVRQDLAKDLFPQPISAKDLYHQHGHMSKYYIGKGELICSLKK